MGVTLVPSPVPSFQREGVVCKALSAPKPTIGLMLLYREDELLPILPYFLQIAHEVAQAVYADLGAEKPAFILASRD